MVGAMHHTVFHAGALHDVAEPEPHLVAREEPEEPFRRLILVILALDPELARERHRALAEERLLRMVGHFHVLFLALRVVVDDELDRVEHRHAPRRDVVQVLAHAVFEIVKSMTWCALETPMRSAKMRKPSGV